MGLNNSKKKKNIHPVDVILTVNEMIEHDDGFTKQERNSTET